MLCMWQTINQDPQCSLMSQYLNPTFTHCALHKIIIINVKVNRESHIYHSEVFFKSEVFLLLELVEPYVQHDYLSML